ncbi:zinc protease [Desulfovibrionales bacterium]
MRRSVHDRQAERALRRALVAVLFVIFFVILGSSGADAAQITRLPNGLVVVAQQDARFPLVSLRLLVRAGSAWEPDRLAGVSHLLEHMVFKKREVRGGERSAGQRWSPGSRMYEGSAGSGRIARLVEDAGGYINAATSFEYTMYLVDLPASHLATGMAALRKLVSVARPQPEALAGEKEVVLAELARGKDNVQDRLFETMQKLIWPDSVFARPIIGSTESVRSITADDIQRYMQDRYQPQSMVLSICGAVTPDAMLAAARHAFRTMRNDRIITPLTPSVPGLPEGGPQIQVATGVWNRVHLALGVPISGFRSDDAAGLEVLAYIIGGANTSRLHRTFQYEYRLVDSITASVIQLEGTGMFYVTVTCGPEKFEELLPALVGWLARLNPGEWDEAELARARLHVRHELFLARETFPGIANKLGLFQFFEHGLDAEARFLRQLDRVDKGHLTGLVRDWLVPGRLGCILLWPDGAAMPLAAAAGGTADNVVASVANIREVRDDVTREAVKNAKGLICKSATVAVGENSSAPADAMAVPQALGRFLADALRRGWPVSRESAAQAFSTQHCRNMETVDIDQNRRIIFLPDATLPYTALNLNFAGGDTLLAPGEQGLAEFLSRTLNKGTTTRTATAVQDLLADRTAELSVCADRALFRIAVKFPTQYGPDIYPLVEDILGYPAFSVTEADRERESQVASIHKQEDQPLGLAFRHIFPFLFRNAPYNYYHQGQPADIAGFTPERTRMLWERQRRQPWTMAVCGEYDRERVLNLARQPFLAAADPRSVLADPVWGTKKIHELTLPDRNQAHLFVIFKAPGLAQPDSAGMNLLRAVLDGQSGPLFSELRERQGLGYSVSAILWQLPQTGFLAFYIGSKPELLGRAQEGFRFVVRRLTTRPLSKAELTRGKNQMEGEYFRNHQSLDSRSSEVASFCAQGLPADTGRRLIDEASILSSADLLALARRYLIWDEAYLLRVLP